MPSACRGLHMSSIPIFCFALNRGRRSVCSAQIKGKKFAAKSSAKSGQTAIQKPENCARSHIPLGPREVKTHIGWRTAMNTINWDLRNLTVQTHSGLRWTDIKRQLTGWRHLEGLDDRSLEDIGISCGSQATPHLISR